MIYKLIPPPYSSQASDTRIAANVWEVEVSLANIVVHRERFRSLAGTIRWTKRQKKRTLNVFDNEED